jgi:N-acetylmuramoyl-L-alanine amidase
MKIKHFLLSLAVVLSSTNVFAEQVVQVAEVTFKEQMFNQASSLVESTVNMIATPFLSDKDIECLARNIFYESRGEPIEGKIAVGIVTINRAQDPRFGQICLRSS